MLSSLHGLTMGLHGGTQPSISSVKADVQRRGIFSLRCSKTSRGTRSSASMQATLTSWAGVNVSPQIYC